MKKENDQTFEVASFEGRAAAERLMESMKEHWPAEYTLEQRDGKSDQNRRS